MFVLSAHCGVSIFVPWTAGPLLPVHAERTSLARHSDSLLSRPRASFATARERRCGRGGGRELPLQAGMTGEQLLSVPRRGERPTVTEFSGSSLERHCAYFGLSGLALPLLQSETGPEHLRTARARPPCSRRLERRCGSRHRFAPAQTIGRRPIRGPLSACGPFAGRCGHRGTAAEVGG